MLKETALAFIDDEALTRGAAIAFYTVTSIAPVLLIVIAIAGTRIRSRRRSERDHRAVERPDGPTDCGDLANRGGKCIE